MELDDRALDRQSSFLKYGWNMMHFINVLLSFSLVLSGNAIANEDIPLPARELVFKLFPAAKTLDWRGGDLNRDGLDDLVVWIAESDNFDSNERIIVLRAKKDVSYELMAKSLSFASVRYTPSTTFLDLEQGSLYVGVSGPADYGSYSSIRFQFKQKKGALRLIGYRARQSKNQDVDDQELSLNFLTGERIEWRKVQKSRKEVKSKLPIRAPLTFEQFDFGGHLPYDTKVYEYTIDSSLHFRKRSGAE